MKLHLPLLLRQSLLSALLICSASVATATQPAGNDSISFTLLPREATDEEEDSENLYNYLQQSEPWLTFSAAPYISASATSNPTYPNVYTNQPTWGDIGNYTAQPTFSDSFTNVNDITKINSASDNNTSNTAGHYFANNSVIRISNSKLNYDERFYDTQKGRYFVYTPTITEDGRIVFTIPVIGKERINKLYRQYNSSLKFLGETLYNYIPKELRNAPLDDILCDIDFIKSFGNDSNTCWRQTCANMLQYWTSYYGVFNISGEKLKYGYTYNPELLEETWGTNSLVISMMLHEAQLSNSGSGGVTFGFPDDVIVQMQGQALDGVVWYLFGGDGMLMTNKLETSSSPGYFREYFSSANSLRGTCAITNQNSLNNSIKSAFRREGQIAGLLFIPSGGGGHVVTCYGYKQNSAGDIIGLWIADNDGCDYGLKFVHVKQGSETVNKYVWSSKENTYVPSGGIVSITAMKMYEKSNCSEDSYYGYITEVTWIETPQGLVNMYEEYQDKSNPLVWNGEKVNNKWQHAGTETPATVDVLPTDATGWEVYCESGSAYGETYFPTYYSAGRGVMFNDHATDYDVVIAGGTTVTAGDMYIDNSKTYNFSSLSGTQLSVGNFSKSGNGIAQFTSVPLTFKVGTLNGGEIRLGGGNRFNGTSLTINSGALLSSYAQNSLNLNKGVLTINAGGTLFADSNASGGNFSITASGVSFNTDSTLHLLLGAENQKIPAITLSGKLTLTSGTIIDLERDKGLQGDKTYYLMKAGSLPSSTLIAAFDVPYGSLAIENGYLVYKYEGVMQWGGTSGVWSASSWDSTTATCLGKNVEFSHTGSKNYNIQVKGKVSPGSIQVTSGRYTFQPYDASTSNAITGVKLLEVSGTATLTTNMPIDAQCITISNEGDLWIETDKNWDINKLNIQNIQSSLSGVYINTAKNTLVRILDSDRIDGTIRLSSSPLEFRFDHSFTFGGDINSASLQSKAIFTNSSTSNDITYRLPLVQTGEYRQWFVVGNEADSHYTTLELTSFQGYREPSFEITSKGILSLNFVSAAKVASTNGGIKGNGTVLVPDGASVVLAGSSNHQPPLLSTIGLDIRGTATLGDTNATYGITGQYASGATVSGKLNVEQSKGTGIYLPTLTLRDGGLYEFHTNRYTTADKGIFYHNFGEVNVTGKSATIHHLEVCKNATYGYEATISDISNIRGSGNLTLSGDSRGSLTLYRILNNKNNSFTGNLTVKQSPVDYYFASYCRMTALELQSGLYGTVTAENTFESAYPNYTGIGIAGDVELDGLIAQQQGIILYSGTLNYNHTLEKSSFSTSAIVNEEANQLVLDVATGKSYSFSGSVHGPLELVKKGSGSQTFTGSFNEFNGSLAVQAGTLNITNSVTASNVNLSKGGTLISNGTVKASHAALTGGSLQAKAITLSDIRINGTGSTLCADAITLSDVNFVISAGLSSSPMLTLQSASGSSGKLTLTANDISFEWETGSSKKTGAYKLLQYSDDFGSYLSGFATSADTYKKNGTSGYYIEKSTLKGETVYTLSYYYNVVKRKATALSWLKSSGTWQDGSGKENEVWSGTEKDLNFYNGDTVSFGMAATITIQGNVTPAAISVSNSSGTVHYYAGSNGGSITGTATLTKTGTGTLHIHNSNTYSGGTIIKAGTLITDNLSSLGKGTVELAGGTLKSNGLDNDILVTGTSALNANQTGTVALGGTLTVKNGTLSGSTLVLEENALLQGGNIKNVLSGTGGVIVRGNATLSGANTYTGDTVVESGQLTISGSLKSDVFMNGGTLYSGNTQTFNGGRSLTLNGGTVYANVSLGTNGLVELKKSASVNGNLTLGGGTLSLGSYMLDVNGTLQLTGNTTLDFTGITSPGTYKLINYNSISGSLSYLQMSAPETSRYTYKLGAASNYVTLTLTTTATTVYWNGNQGIWKHATQGGWQEANGNNSAALQFLNGDTVVFNNGGSVQIAGDVTPAALTISGSNDLYLSGSGRITGGTGLNKTGSGLLALNAENTYTGGTAVKEGTVVAGGSKSFGSGSITVSSGATLELGNYAVANSITLNGGTFSGNGYTGLLTTTGYSKLGDNTRGRIYMASGSLENGSITNSAITADQGYLYTSISGTSTLTKQSSGTLYIYGNSTYTGTTNVAAGTLYAKNDNALGSGTVTVQSGASLNMGNYALANDITSYGATLSGSNYKGALTIAGNTTLSGNFTAESILISKGNLTGGTIYNTPIEARISGGAPIIESTLKGDGDITLYSGTLGIYTTSNNSEFTGDIYIKGGTLYLAGNRAQYDVKGALGTGTIYLEGGTLQWEEGPIIYNDVEVSGNAQVNGPMFRGNLTLRKGSVGTWYLGEKAYLYEGTIGNLQNTGTGEVYKKGKGTVRLNGGAGGSGGSKLYVEQGTLEVNCDYTPANEVYMKGGTLTLLKDVTTAYTQTYHLEDGVIKGNLVHAGSNSIIYGGEGYIDGNLTLAGGMISTAEGHPIVVTGTLTLSSKSLLDFSNIREDGDYEFIRYGKLSGSTSGMFAASDGDFERGNYTFSTENNSLWIHFTRTAATLNWTAASGVWAQGSTGDDWNISSSDKKFYDGDEVVFNNGGNVTITGYVSPGKITVSGSKNLTFINNGSITGNLTLTKTGTGTLTMNGTNSYSGSTIIQGGVVKAAGEDFSYDQTNTSFGVSTIELQGGTLDLAGQPIGNVINVTKNSTINNGEKYTGSLTVKNTTLSGNTLNVSQDMEVWSGTVKNNLSGTGNVTALGAVTFSGSNTLNGHLIVMRDYSNSTEGYLTAQNTTLKGNISIWGSTLVLGSGKTQVMEKGTTLEMNEGYLQSNLLLQSGSQLNSLSYGLKVSGTLTLNGGGISLTSSTYKNEGAGMVIGGNLNLQSPTELVLSGFSHYGDSPFTLAKYADLNGNLSQLTLTFSDSSRIKGTLRDTGTKLILTVSGGAEDIYWNSGSGTWKEAAAGAWRMNEDNSKCSFMRGDAVTFANGGSVTISGEVKPGSITVEGENKLTFSGSGKIAGDTELVMNGYGTLTMNATNTYSGGTTINDGIVTAGGAKSFGSGIIQLDGGELKLGKYAVKNDIISDGGTLSGTAYAGALQFCGGYTTIKGTFMAGSIELGDSSYTYYSPVVEGGIIKNTAITAIHGYISSQITGTSSLTVGKITLEELGDAEYLEDEGYKITISGSNNYTGGTVVMEGLLIADNQNALGTGDVTIYSGGLDMKNHALTNNLVVKGYAAINNAEAFMGKLHLNGGTIDEGKLHLNEAKEHVLSSGNVLSGLHGGTKTALDATRLQITKNSSGTVYLSGDYSNLYSHITLQDGTLYIDSKNWNSHITVNQGTLQTTDLKISNSTLTLAGGKLAGSYALSGTGNIKILSDMQLDGSLTLGGGRVDWTDISKLDINGTLHLTAQTTLYMGNNFEVGVYELAEFNELQGALTLLNVTGDGSRRNYSLYEEDYKLYLKVDGVAREHLWTSGGSKVWELGTNFGASRTDGYRDGDAVTFSAAGTIRLNSVVSPADVEVTGSGSLSITGNGYITGETALTKNGSGTLTISNTNAYSGGTIINSGTVVAGNKNAFGLGDITLNTGATLNLNKKEVDNDIIARGGTLTNANAYEGHLTVEGAVNIANKTQLRADKITLASGSLSGGSITNTQVVMGGGSLYSTLTGTSNVQVNGTATLAAANTHSGNTELYTGKLTITNTQALGTGDMEMYAGQLDMRRLAVTNTLINKGDVSISNADCFAGKLVVESGRLSGSAIQLQQDAMLTGGEVAAPLIGNAGVNVLGNVILSGNNTYTGQTNIASGTLQLTGSIASDLIINGGSLTTAENGMLLSSGQNMELLNGSINGMVTVLTGATLTLSDTRTQSFDLNLGGGTLIIDSGNINMQGAIYITSDSTLDVGRNFGYGTHTLLTAQNITNEDKQLLTLEKERVGGRAYSLEWVGDKLMLNVEKCSKNLVWNGSSSGTWAMNGATTWLSDGEVAFFETDDAVEFNNNGTIRISGTVEMSGMKVTNTGTLTISSASSKDPGSISSFGSVVKYGKGTLALNLANSYTGGTYLYEGTLKLGNANALGSGEVYLYGGTLNLGKLAVTNDIRLLGDTIILNGTKFAGNLTMEGALMKGSSLNLNKDCTATIISGNIAGTFSGQGTVKVTGDATLNGGKISTSNLVIDGAGARLNASTTSGLAMQKTANILIQNGGNLQSAGAITAGNLSINGAQLNSNNSKARAITISKDIEIIHGSNVSMYGALTANNLRLENSQLKNGLADEYLNSNIRESAQTITVKGGMSLSKSELTTNGKITVTNALELANGSQLTLAGALKARTLQIDNAALTLSAPSAQSVTLSGKETSTLSHADVQLNGKLSATGSLILEQSYLHLSDSSTKKAAQSLTVKGDLAINGMAADEKDAIYLTGALSAASLSMKDAALTLENSVAAQKVTISNSKATNKLTNATLDINGNMSVSGALEMLNSGISLRDASTKKAAQSLTVKGAFTIDGMATDQKDAIYLTGALSAGSLSMKDAALTLENSVAAQKVTISNSKATNKLTNATLDINGNMSVSGALEMLNSEISLRDESAKKAAQSLTVKGDFRIEDSNYDKDAELKLTGRLSANSISLYNADISMVECSSAQAVSVTKALQMEHSRMTAFGSVTANDIYLTQNAHLYVYDPIRSTAQNVTAKNNLILGANSSLTLSGTLKAKNLTLDGGTLNITSNTLKTVAVSGTLTLNNACDFNIGADLQVGKTVNIFTFRQINLGGDGNLYSLLGMDDAYCTLAINEKNKVITLTVTDAALWQQYRQECLQPVEMAETPVASATTTNGEVGDDFQSSDFSASQDSASSTGATADVTETTDEVDEDDEETIEELLAVTINQEVEAQLIKATIDSLVQNSWAMAEASRAFRNTLDTRHQNSQLLPHAQAAAWVSVLGAQNRISCSGGNAGSQTSMSGATFGMEWYAGEKSAFGLALGYSSSKVSTFGASTIDQDMTHAAVYGQTLLWNSNSNTLTLDWSVLYGQAKNEGTIAGLNSDWKQNTLQLNARASWSHAIDERTAINVFAGAEYLTTDSAGIVDNVDIKSLQNLRAEVGAGISSRVSERLLLHGEASFIGDVVRHNPTATVADTQGTGSNPGRIGMGLRMGAGYQLNENWTLHASYNMNLMQNASSHNANIGATYSF